MDDDDDDDDSNDHDNTGESVMIVVRGSKMIKILFLKDWLGAFEQDSLFWEGIG